MVRPGAVKVSRRRRSDSPAAEHCTSPVLRLAVSSAGASGICIVQPEELSSPMCQLHLGAFMRPISVHTGAWQYPGAWPEANFSLPHIREMITALEAARFDAFFMADHLAVLNMPADALKHSHSVTSFESFTLLSALAMTTERIGLIVTASTYQE